MCPTERIRVLIVDDEPVARRGLRNHLKKAADIEVIGEAANVKVVYRWVRHGNKGVKLRAVEVPGVGLCTSDRWIADFIAALNAPPVPAPYVATCQPSRKLLRDRLVSGGSR